MSICPDQIISGASQIAEDRHEQHRVQVGLSVDQPGSHFIERGSTFKPCSSIPSEFVFGSSAGHAVMIAHPTEHA